MNNTDTVEESVTPEVALRRLKEGNFRFFNNILVHKDFLGDIFRTKDEQTPYAAILSCMDSRTSVELIFDQGLGDLFSIRVAGNIVNDDILASLEYAVKYVGSKVLMVLGHTECGAIKSAKAGVQDGHITGLLNRIQPSISKAMLKGDHDHHFSDHVAYANVENSLEEILTRSDIVKDMFKKGDIGIVGGVYNIESGEVDFFKNLTKKKKEDKQLTTV